MGALLAEMPTGGVGVERSYELFKGFYNIIFNLLRGRVRRVLLQAKWEKILLAGGGGLCAHPGVPDLFARGAE